MVLTEEEKRELAKDLKKLIVAESTAVDELPEADTLEGVGSLPAYQEKDGVTTTVSVPVPLLAKPAIDAATEAQQVTGLARVAIQDAQNATAEAREAAASVEAVNQEAAAATAEAREAAKNVETAIDNTEKVIAQSEKAISSAYQAVNDADNATTTLVTTFEGIKTEAETVIARANTSADNADDAVKRVDNFLSDANDKLVSNVDRENWNQKVDRTEIPTSLPANGGNADTVGGYPLDNLGKIISSPVADIDNTPGFFSGFWNTATAGTKPGGYGTVLQVTNKYGLPNSGKEVWVFQIAHVHGIGRPVWRQQYNNGGWSTWEQVALMDDVMSKLSHIPDIMDANNVSENGAGRTGAATINTPTSGLGGYLVNYIWDVNASHQMFLSLDTQRCFTRVKIGGEWSDWKQVALMEDISPVGSVRFDQILDADNIAVELDHITRRVIDCHSKSGLGYISRAAIGLLNNNGFSYPIISAGLDDNGTRWADWKFRHTDGRIIAPNNKYFAFDDDVLKNSGEQTLSNGRLNMLVSAPEHVIMFKDANGNIGYIGFGAYPTEDLQIMNYATGKYINIAADGKLYYDQQELAFNKDIISAISWGAGTEYGPRLDVIRRGGTDPMSAIIPRASTTESGVVTTIAQTFAGRKSFNAGIDITAGGMSVNGGIAVDNGTITCTGEISAANGFYETSDVRLKKNITPIHLSGERIRLCEFDKSGRHGYGVIAQEVEKLYPAAVKEENGYKVVNYTEVLTIKCAEQDERIEALERENISLKERLERLEKLLLK
ncbi:MAG: tail fiber domain-containing protein [Odoribacter splanchnicus]|nr:tail fiber domain-containing protein [Odoribacter splanchnicus]